jgi:hypothetical protein
MISCAYNTYLVRWWCRYFAIVGKLLDYIFSISRKYLLIFITTQEISFASLPIQGVTYTQRCLWQTIALLNLVNHLNNYIFWSLKRHSSMKHFLASMWIGKLVTEDRVPHVWGTALLTCDSENLLLRLVLSRYEALYCLHATPITCYWGSCYAGVRHWIIYMPLG